MTAVVERAEKAGKEVKPLIVPTNNPLHAVLKTAMDLQAQELFMGASHKLHAPTSSWSRSPSTGSACTAASRRRSRCAS